MKYDYLRETMILNIEKEYGEEIDPEGVIDQFYPQKSQHVQLK